MRSSAFLIAVLLLPALPAAAQTSYPMLMSAHPVAAQIGTTTEVTVKSRYSMLGAFEVIVSGEGVSGEVVPPEVKEGQKPNLQALNLKFHVDPEAQPGVRDFRLATPNGASTLGQLVLVRDPIVAESGKNNTRDEATEVTLPATVCGTIERNEDVDYYKFHAEAGTTLCFHVQAMRLQDRIHDLQQHVDPIITLRNSMGTTIAAADNEFYGDPFLAHRFEQSGDYFLEIRDVRYQGNAYWEYCIEINDRPFVTNVFPMAVSPGTQAELQLVGANLPEDIVSTPAVGDVAFGLQWLALPLSDGSVTNPAPVVVTDLPIVVETPAGNDILADAQPFTAPAGICGRIEAEADVDCFRFEAKKGEKWSFEVIARRHQSMLDPQLRLLDANGKQLSLQDDLRWGKRTYADSWLEGWTAPADGTYAIELRDLHLRGGAEFVYYVKVTRAEPYFELFADTDKTQLSPGLASVLFVRAERKNGFDGEITLAVDGMPEGVKASCGRILAGQQDGCIVFEAGSETKLVASNIAIRGEAPWKSGEAEQTLTAMAVPYQETYMPGGGRGHWPVGMHTVCVGDACDIRAVKLSTYDVTLKPGESQRIDVEIERAEGFDKNVSLELLYRHLSGVYGNALPPGVTFDEKNSSKLLGAKASKGHITLKAAPDAKPVDKQQIAVMADVSLNFVMKRSYTSAPLFVTVTSGEDAK